jgi:hypothetical protein
MRGTVVADRQKTEVINPRFHYSQVRRLLTVLQRMCNMRCYYAAMGPQRSEDFPQRRMYTPLSAEPENPWAR